MERKEARLLAHELSFSASEALLDQRTFIELPRRHSGTSIASICANHQMTADMVSAPWSAYSLALHDDEEVFYALRSGVEGLLATIPIDYRVEALPSQVVGPYADSLVSHLVSLINFAEEELLVVGPYWSEEGVTELRSRIEVGKKTGLLATVFTAANLNESNITGLNSFVRILTNDLGAQVRVLAPQRLERGYHPLVHAKVVVADRKRAYVGSANFSQNGLANSIEMGLGVTGTYALRLHEWFRSLEPYFAEACPEKEK